VQPQKWVDLIYRFRLANSDLTANRQEVGTTLYGGGATLSINYIAFSKLAPDNTTVTTTGLTRPKTTLHLRVRLPHFPNILKRVAAARRKQS